VNFKHSEIHPMHLKRNEIYLGDEFYQMMSDSGFLVKHTRERLTVFGKHK
jgi:hypothetical protein